MRAGVSTVQQTLTTEAANVLKLAVAEAQRRGHAQVTPLHVATTLLSGSSSVLRQACVQSHLHLQQPPHCRNLELCFKVALDRLQTSSSSGGSSSNSSSGGGGGSAALHGHHHHHHHHLHQPALSNALVAALKRAQAHQRRGYPEQQQVPLLAVKVEMEQLIISILDDPSVSRVMREASFSSTQVKSSLEEALAAAAIAASSAGSSTSATTSCAAAQARRILPASPLVSSNPPAAAGAIPSPPGSGSAADRLRLKLGSLEQYGAASFGGLRSSSSGRNAAADHHQLLLNMIPPSSTTIGNPAAAAPPPGGRFSGDVARVFEILVKVKKRNPLLFGEQSPHPVAEEVMRRLERGECPEPGLRSLRIVSPQFASIALGLHAREEVEAKVAEMIRTVEKNLLCTAGVLIYLGDLQWLVERPSPPPAAAAGSSPSSGADVYCPVAYTVNEIGKLVSASSSSSSRSGGDSRVWLMAVASSQTYMRCQARHPSLDSLWGLQPLPISGNSSSRSAGGAFSLGLRNSLNNNSGSISMSSINNNSNSRFGGAVDSPALARSNLHLAAAAAAGAPPRWPMLPFKQQPDDGSSSISENCCPECSSRLEQELSQELEKPESMSSSSSKNNGLPFWLKPTRDPDQVIPGSRVSQRQQLKEELQRKWSQTCRSLHGHGVTTTMNTKVGTTAAGAGSLAMTIPWLSLHATGNGNKGTTSPPATTTSLASIHNKDVGSVSCNNKTRSSPEIEVDFGLSLKPLSSSSPPPPPPSGSSRSPSWSTDQKQQQQQEPEVAMIQTELVLGRSGSKVTSNGSLSTSEIRKPEKPVPFPVAPPEDRLLLQTPERQFPQLTGNGSLSTSELRKLEKPVPFVVSPLQTPEKQFPPPAAAAAAPSIIMNNNTVNPPIISNNSSNIHNPPIIPMSNNRLAATPAPAPAPPAPAPGKDLDFKALCKALSESVPWQKEAVDSIASTVLHCRSGGEKRRGSNITKYDAWLLLLGSDAPAKRRVARVLAEQVFGSDKSLFRLSLRCRDFVDTGQPGRGRTPLDKLAEAVRLRPFSVILLEDIEEADFRLKSALLKAIDRGRLADSSGREVSVANLIVVMTSSIGVEVFSEDSPGVDSGEVAGMKLLVEAAAPQELVTFKSGRVSVVRSDAESPKRKAPVGFDLNEPLEEDERTGGEPLFEEVSAGDERVSEEEQVKLLLERAEDQLSKQFFTKMSRTMVFRPFNFDKLAELVVSEINSAVLTSKLSIEIESGLLRHLVANLWEGRHEEFQKWVIQSLDTGTIEKLKNSNQQQQQQQQSVIRLVAERSSEADVVRLPKRIRIGDAGGT